MKRIGLRAPLRPMKGVVLDDPGARCATGRCVAKCGATTPQAVGGEERQRRDESRSHDLEAHEDANSVPRTPEWTCHAVLPCLLIEAAAFKSLVFSAGCHVRAGDQTGSRPALALIAR
jgi:hypothetical protein